MFPGQHSQFSPQNQRISSNFGTELYNFIQLCINSRCQNPIHIDNSLKEFFGFFLTSNDWTHRCLQTVNFPFEYWLTKCCLYKNGIVLHLSYILVYLSCHNKMPYPGWLNNVNLFLTFLETGIPRSLCRQGRFHAQGLGL